ncbi:MAG TPA: shikimate dehydrogenase [Candidatus Polarisedimenticolia bacterium]|jgi:3-dehydroquinate dehydratase/shikimate dehydrogenase
MIILSLVERDVAEMRREILSAPEKAGAVEVRLDTLGRVDPTLLFEGAPRPLIATCRRKADGGFFAGSEKARREVLWAAVRAGASYIDVEQGTAAANLAEDLVSAPGVGVILSHHDLDGMPRDLDGLYRRMARVKGIKAVKIVGTARAPADMIKVRDFLQRHRRASPPVISFCSGATGVMSRIMALEWGSWATYASAGFGREAAPGQASLPDLVGMYRIEDIDHDTRFAVVIGSPLARTLSPAIHNAAYHTDGLNSRYIPMEIPDRRGLRDLRRIARQLKIRGFSVTAPYKIPVMRHLDVIEPLAKRIGAVNTVVCDGKRLFGFNTDASGGLAAMEEALSTMDRTVEGLTVAIVGAGGSARAMAHATARAGASVVVASRNAAPGRALAKAVGGRHVTLSHLSRERYDVLINCTPVGMGREACPVTRAAIKGILVYDVIYTPETTALLRQARGRGIATLGGLEMLVRQAAEQYTLFTGRAAPLGVMREAARLARGRVETRG